MPRVLPALYAILDAETIARRSLELLEVARTFRLAGISLLQYRDKTNSPSMILANARQIKRVFDGSGCVLILNDEPNLARAAEWDGVHVGQGDASVDEARQVIGENGWVGVSTHTVAEMQAAESSSADYVAVGPVFRTSSKSDAQPVLGVQGVAMARTIVKKPLVAIGGITRARARGVLEAGANSVAVISGLLSESMEETTREFLRELR